MTRKQMRGIFIGVGVGVLGLAAVLVLTALQDSIVFFHSPTDVLEKKIEPGQRFRLGGLVEVGSVQRDQGTEVKFTITDANRTINVRYQGVLPDLFREGQGVVTEGKLVAAGYFQADSVLAKHDENYMPPEVADSLRKQGHWRGGGEDAKPADSGAYGNK